MNISIIGNEVIPINWDKELYDKDIIVRIFPNVFNDIYNVDLFNKEHHAILNGLYNNETSFDLIPDQRDSLLKYHKIKFMYINRDKDLVELINNFKLESIRHLANDQLFKAYMEEMEHRYGSRFSVESKTLLYYCFTYRDDIIHSYRFGLKNNKTTSEKKFINSLALNHIAHD